MMGSIASDIFGLSPWAALLVVFALPALESSAFVGFVFPGEIALILGGSSWQHGAHVASRIGLAALAVLVAAALGGYALRHSGPRRFARLAAHLASSAASERTRTRFPRTAAWVHARLDRNVGTGLALTTALAVAVAATWTFLGITQDVGGHEELALLDPRVHHWVLTHRNSGLDLFFKTVTWLGAGAVTTPVLAACGAVLARARRSWTPILDIAAVYGTAVLAHAVVAQVMHRHRPPVAEWLSPAHGWSYPSGHTTQAVAAWGILAILVSVRARPRPRIAAVAAAATVVTLVGVSRIYLGMHWTTDVLAGGVMAAAVLALWFVFRLTRTTPRQSPNLTRGHLRDVAATQETYQPRRQKMHTHGSTLLAGSRRTLVVIPTYNEAGNMANVLQRVRAAAPHVDILVVDDNSPDGTAAIVTGHPAYAEQTRPRKGSPGRVFLLPRTAKDGLGSAYRAGFAWALARDYDAVVQMDADLSHPPERIPALLDALDDRADVAVGSRYVPGGGVDNWSGARRFISRAGNLYVRLVLGLPVHDTTAGFKAFHVDALERIGAVESSSNGYCFQVENTWRAVRLGLHVREVPITFTDRTAGTSKMSGHIVAEALARVLVWRLGELLGGTTRATARHRAPVANQDAATRPPVRAHEPKASRHAAA